MNPEAARTMRTLKFYQARQIMQRILKDGLISEDDYNRMIKLLAEEFEVDAKTGSALRTSKYSVWGKDDVDERYLTYENLTKYLKKESGNPATAIITWLRSHNTFEFLREWEKKNNPKFNEDGYQELMNSGNKTITPKIWCEKTNAIGIISRQGNKGGIYAHPMIFADFKMWESALLRYYLMDVLVNGMKAFKPEERERKIVEIKPKRVE